MKYCDFNGCSNKLRRGAYCDEHKRSKKSIRSKRKKKEIYHHDNQPFYKSNDWKYVRSIVYQREKGCCQRCKRFVFGRQAHCHHVIPISKDDTLKLEPNNIRLLCPKCHVIEENDDTMKKVIPSYFNK